MTTLVHRFHAIHTERQTLETALCEDSAEHRAYGRNPKCQIVVAVLVAPILLLLAARNSGPRCRCWCENRTKKDDTHRAIHTALFMFTSCDLKICTVSEKNGHNPLKAQGAKAFVSLAEWLEDRPCPREAISMYCVGFSIFSTVLRGSQKILGEPCLRVVLMLCRACTHVYVYVCMYVCTYGCMYVCMYVCMYCVCVCVCMRVCLYVRMYVRMYMCVRM